MKGVRLLMAAALGVGLPLCCASTAFAQFVPPPPCDQVDIVGVPRVSGTGCPQGTAQVILASTTPGCRSTDFIEVLFDNFTAESGMGVPFAKRRQQCTVEITLRVPSGLRFTVASVHYEGYADLPSGASTATLTSDYFIPIPPGVTHATLAKTIRGPYVGPFGKDDTLEFFSLVWPPMCSIDVPSNLRSILEVNGPSLTNAIITVDQLSGKLRQFWGLKWARCP